MTVEEREKRMLEKLEKYFPEHKVFAFNSIDKNLREQGNQIARIKGFSSIEEYFATLGYSFIKGDEVKKIRDRIIYSPGNEPEIIKSKVDTMVRRLNEFYPTHIIEHSLQSEHKDLSKTVSGLYQWLGYETVKDMLKTYGFEYEKGCKAGAPTKVNPEQIVETLKERYPNGSGLESLADLKDANPDVGQYFKTIQNKQKELFGMSFVKYLVSLGVLDEKGRGKGRGIDEILAELIARAKVSDEIPESIAQLEYINRDIDEISKLKYYIRKEFDEKPSIFLEKKGLIKKKTEEEVQVHNQIREKKKEIYTLLYKLQRKYYNRSIPINYAALVRENYDFGFNSLEKNIKELFGISAPEFFKAYNLIVELYESERTNSSSEIFVVYGDVLQKCCTNQDSITIPKGIRVIKKEAFLNCEALEEMQLPDSLQRIEGEAFAKCKKLREIFLPDSIKHIGPFAFEGCHSLEKVRLPFLLRTIPRYAFSNCSNMSTIIWPERLSIIETGAFLNCDKLEVIVLPTTLKIIEGHSFANIESLKKIILPPKLKTINKHVFHNCIKLEEIELLNEIKEIKDYAFANCIAMKKVVFSSNLIHIESNAFANCNSLEEIILPPKLKYIGEGAFEKCSKLQKVEIPNTVREIKREAFACCNNLESVIFKGCTTIVYSGVFKGCKYLKQVVLPNNISYIPYQLFFGCENLEEIHLPDTVKTICKEAFCDCKNLKRINIEKIECIEEKAFYGCNTLELVFNNRLKISGRNIFGGCKSVVAPYNYLSDVSSIQDRNVMAVGYIGNMEKYTEEMIVHEYKNYLFDKRRDIIDLLIKNDDGNGLAELLRILQNAKRLRASDIRKVYLPIAIGLGSVQCAAVLVNYARGSTTKIDYKL